MSGPAILPLALRHVYAICQTVAIPVIGMGGVTTGDDALQMVMAGATAVGIGTAVVHRGIDVFDKVVDELSCLLARYGHGSLADVRGLAHRRMLSS